MPYALSKITSVIHYRRGSSLVEMHSIHIFLMFLLFMSTSIRCESSVAYKKYSNCTVTRRSAALLSLSTLSATILSPSFPPFLSISHSFNFLFLLSSFLVFPPYLSKSPSSSSSFTCSNPSSSISALTLILICSLPSPNLSSELSDVEDVETGKPSNRLCRFSSFLLCVQTGQRPASTKVEADISGCCNDALLNTERLRLARLTRLEKRVEGGGGGGWGIDSPYPLWPQK
ncbi:hypothetical protein K402DRAFT_406653 [Aulographum hederae CBS 113979]|uniref:Uncharacterized protein n=1 Tax=Aulographum hederae CBS 113979 TaxID=1176131 RepID=A0A6G1GSA8_9PEZI|nr:hypothetical protein K402DRAFT_406653 [Aulographum hederae CBS 113979]